MANLWQNKINNEIEQIKEEITLLQDNLKQSKKKKIYCKMGKSESQKCKTKKRQNALKQIAKMQNLLQTKKRQNLIQTAKMQNIFQNEIEKIK